MKRPRRLHQGEIRMEGLVYQMLAAVCLLWAILPPQGRRVIGSLHTSVNDLELYDGSGDVDGDLPGEPKKPTEEDREQQAARDVVDRFLSIVEQYERNKENCTPGTEFNLGEGVVAQYGVLRYKAQALVAVNRANFLTRIWKGAPVTLLQDEHFFFTAVRSMVEGDPDLFAAGNCYDYKEFKNYTLYCPYAYRLPNDSSEIMVKDLSVEYMYLGNESEFFYQARVKAAKKLRSKYNKTIGEYLVLYCEDLIY